MPTNGVSIKPLKVKLRGAESSGVKSCAPPTFEVGSPFQWPERFQAAAPLRQVKGVDGSRSGFPRGVRGALRLVGGSLQLSNHLLGPPVVPFTLCWGRVPLLK